MSFTGYTAVRSSAGVIDRRERGLIGVSGKDRTAFLHGLLTNDVKALSPGEGCYSAYLTPQGRMICDMYVYEHADATWLDVVLSRKDALAQKLDRLIFTEDARVHDLTPQYARFAVHGPDAVIVVSRALAPLDALPLHSHAALDTLFGRAIVVRTDELRDEGFALYVESAHADACRESLRGAGAEDVDAEAAHALRLEAGVPLFGADMDEHTIPLEAGIEARAIDMSKGCFVGHEVIARVTYRGHGRVAKRLCGLVMDAAEVPTPGAEVFAADRSVGRVTSAAYSPGLAKGIALAYIHRDFVEPGVRLRAAQGEASIQCAVTTLPFAT